MQTPKGKHKTPGSFAHSWSQAPGMLKHLSPLSPILGRVAGPAELRGRTEKCPERARTNARKRTEKTQKVPENCKDAGTACKSLWCANENNCKPLHVQALTNPILQSMVKKKSRSTHTLACRRSGWIGGKCEKMPRMRTKNVQSDPPVRSEKS